MDRIYWVLKSLLCPLWLFSLMAVPTLGGLYWIAYLASSAHAQFERTDGDACSDSLVAGYWSFMDREHLFGKNDLSEVQKGCRALSADGTLAFHSSSGVLEHCAQELSAVSGADSDIRSLLGGIRRMQFLNCDFTTGDWSLLSQLADLEVVEFCDVKRTSDETNEAYIRSSAAALSKLPRLQTLLLTGGCFLGVGRMPELRTLGLELGMVEQFLAGDVSGRFPRLETILIRIPSKGEVSAGVYARLRGIRQLRELHLWSGNDVSVGLLTRHLDEFRRQLPALSVSRRAWGLRVWDGFFWVISQFALVASGLLLTVTFIDLSSTEAIVVMPGLCRVHQQVLVMLYVLAAAGGFLLASVLGVRAWAPVLTTVLSVSLMVLWARASARLRLSRRSGLCVFVTLLVGVGLLSRHTVYLCSALHGDNSLLNLLFSSVTVAAVFYSIPAMRRMPGNLVESGHASFLQSVLQGPGREVSSEPGRGFRGDLADRLKYGGSFRSIKSLITFGLYFMVVQVPIKILIGFQLSRIFDEISHDILTYLGLALGITGCIIQFDGWGRSFWLWDDLLMPCSRAEFWRAVRVSVFRGLRWFYLSAMFLPLVLLAFDHSVIRYTDGQSIPLLALMWIFRTASSCLLHHGILCWVMTDSRRIWHCLVAAVLWQWTCFPLVAKSLSWHSGGDIVPSLLILVAGGLLQWRLPGWMESAEYPSKRITG